MTRCESTLEVMGMIHRCELAFWHPGEHRTELRHCTLCWENTPKPVTADELDPDGHLPWCDEAGCHPECPKAVAA